MRRINGVDMVDVREAAAMTGRNAETVRRWVRDDRITAIKRGNRLLLSKTEVLQIAGQGQTRQQVSLRDWLREVERRTGRGIPGGTAADIVLQDRSEREQAGARAGR